MGVNIQRHADVRMTHDILQCLWIHSGFRHIGTEGVSAYMRGYFWHLDAKIKGFSVRETKNSGIIELPDKVYVRETVDFATEQKTLYDRVREELKIEVVKDGELIEDDSSAIVKRLLRLVQVTSNTRLVDDSYLGESAKEAVLDRLIREILAKEPLI